MDTRGATRGVGNDVVDFSEAGWQPRVADYAFARFAERTCTAEERALVADAPDRERMLFSLFAAKEAAYKLVARLRPGLMFAHRAFVVSEQLSAVRHDDLFLQLELCIRPEYVHAVAWLGAAKPFWQTAALAPDESAGQGVRRLAAVVLARRLGCRSDEVSIVREPHPAYWDGRGPPEVLVRGERAPFIVSLSHHGRFVGCSALWLDH